MVRDQLALEGIMRGGTAIEVDWIRPLAFAPRTSQSLPQSWRMMENSLIRWRENTSKVKAGVPGSSVKHHPSPVTVMRLNTIALMSPA